MKTKVHSLLLNVEDMGFQPVFFDKELRSFHFSKDGNLASLYNHLILHGLGTRVVYCDIAISVTRGPVIQGNLQLMPVKNETLYKGFNYLTPAFNMEAWSKYILTNIPIKLAHLEKVLGASLLKKTVEGRHAAAQCIELVAELKSLEQVDRFVRRSLSSEEIDEALRLTNFPVVVQFVGGHDVYFPAICLLMLAHKKVGDPLARGVSPLAEKQILREIQLACDRLLFHVKYPLPIVIDK